MRPVVCGYVMIALIFLSGPMKNTERTVTFSFMLGWMQVVQLRDLAVGVGDQRVVEGGALGLLDVGQPAVVRLDRVDAHADELDVALVELALAVGERTELGGADRA